MKRAEVLIVETINGEKRIIEEKDIDEILKKIENVDEIVINKVTLPTTSDENDLVGVHVIVREIAET